MEISKSFLTGKFKFSPECISADKGALIIVKLKFKKGKKPGSAKISPRNPADTWLAGTNAANTDYITITVPNVPSGDYKYDFTNNTQCADPRVHVN